MTVIRSVSDAVEPSSKYSSMRRYNGFLRRPEILETVYSVEEDGDSENNQDPSESIENSECEERRSKHLGNGKGRLQDLYGSFERLAQEADSPPSERPRDECQQAQVGCPLRERPPFREKYSIERTSPPWNNYPRPEREKCLHRLTPFDCCENLRSSVDLFLSDENQKRELLIIFGVHDTYVVLLSSYSCY